MKRLLDILFAIASPLYWISNEPSSNSYDNLVNQWIETDADVELVDKYTVLVNEHMVWTSNYPYAYGYLYGKSRVLPYRRTRKRLKKFIEQKIFESMAQQ